MKQLTVREPDDRNGHVRFDERGEETERWTSRRKRPRKTPLASGAAGPASHPASPRLYQQSDDGGLGRRGHSVVRRGAGPRGDAIGRTSRRRRRRCIAIAGGFADPEGAA